MMYTNCPFASAVYSCSRWYPRGRVGSEHKSGESVHENVVPEQLNADTKVTTAVAMLVETWSVIRSRLDERGTGSRIEAMIGGPGRRNGCGWF
jgi:hypothetical protein